MYLRDAGYNTYLFGQQHEGRTELLGFDEAFVPTPLCMMKSVTRTFTDFLKYRARDDEPFFASVGFFEPHRHPNGGYPEEVYGKGETAAVPPSMNDTPNVRKDLYGFYQAIHQADEHTGKILEALNESGLADDTLVIFVTDHGAAFPRAKSTLYNAGLEISLMMRLPSKIEAGRRIQTLASGVDLLPTILEAVDLPIPENIEGISHWPEVSGQGQAAPHRPIFAEKNFHDGYDPIRAVIDGKYKYIHNFKSMNGFGVPKDIERSPSISAYADDLSTLRPDEELYDTESDPNERNNLAANPGYQSIKHRLRTTLFEWMEDTGDYLPERAATPPVGDEWCQERPIIRERVGRA
jgi:arylsulfatase A-like enzyme